MENRKRDMVNAQGRAGTNYIEKSELSAAIELLNELISANRGIIEVYETAVARLENETNIELLQRYAQQHETFVSKLSSMVVNYGGEPETDSSGGSLLKRTWVSLKAAVTEGDGPILAEVAEDAETILEAYREAMGYDLPEDVREIIRKHISQVRVASEKVSALAVAYNS